MDLADSGVTSVSYRQSVCLSVCHISGMLELTHRDHACSACVSVPRSHTVYMFKMIHLQGTAPHGKRTYIAVLEVWRPTQIFMMTSKTSCGGFHTIEFVTSPPENIVTSRFV